MGSCYLPPIRLILPAFSALSNVRRTRDATVAYGFVCPMGCVNVCDMRQKPPVEACRVSKSLLALSAKPPGKWLLAKSDGEFAV